MIKKKKEKRLNLYLKNKIKKLMSARLALKILIQYQITSVFAANMP